MRYLIALCIAVMGLAGCATTLNQPIAPENIAVMMLMLDRAQEAIVSATDEYRAAQVANDEARLVQAQRRIDMALQTIERVNAMMARGESDDDS